MGCPMACTVKEPCMPKYDVYHEPVKRALIKDGWTITDDPYVLSCKGLRLYADLGAEKPLAAEKSDRKIVVEIKVFGTHRRSLNLKEPLGSTAFIVCC